MRPRFLLDEHINRAIQRQLRRLNADIEVLSIGDRGAPSSGMSDPDILTWLEENGLYGSLKRVPRGKGEVGEDVIKMTLP